MNIILRNKQKPSGFHWEAIADDYQPGDPRGFGVTQEAAIADLKKLRNDRARRTAEIQRLLVEA